MQCSHPRHVDPINVNVDAHLQTIHINPPFSSSHQMAGVSNLSSLTLLSIVMIACPSLSLMLSSKTTFTVSHIGISGFCLHTLYLSSIVILKSIKLKYRKAPQCFGVTAGSKNKIHQMFKTLQICGPTCWDGFPKHLNYFQSTSSNCILKLLIQKEAKPHQGT